VLQSRPGFLAQAVFQYIAVFAIISSCRTLAYKLQTAYWDRRGHGYLLRYVPLHTRRILTSPRHVSTLNYPALHRRTQLSVSHQSLLLYICKYIHYIFPISSQILTILLWSVFYSTYSRGGSRVHDSPPQSQVCPHCPQMKCLVTVNGHLG